MKAISVYALAFAAILFTACGSKKTSSPTVDSVDTTSTETAIEDENVTDFYKSESTTATDEYSSVEGNSSDEASTNDEVSSSSATEDWDSLLDTYKEYVDEYVALAKKVKKGDEDLMPDAISLMQKANDLSSKLQSAKDEMSAGQVARYMKISAKLATVAL